MAKKNPTTPPAAAPLAAAAGPKWRYIGPFYTKYIQLGNGDRVKPFHDSLVDGGVEAFLVKYPERAGWFEKIEAEPEA